MSEQQQTLTIQQAIDLALQHHNGGRLPQAESIYQQILQTDPNQPVALHLLGVIAHQTGKNDIAVDRITKALAIKPDYAEAHSNLGLALQELGKLEEAVASYHKALAIKPDFVEALTNLGNTLRELDRIDEAVAIYRKAIAANPKFVEAHNNLGNALQALGRFDDAKSHINKAIAIKPDYAEAHNNLGAIYLHLERLEEAVTSCRNALAINADFVAAHSNLGLALHRLGRLENAVASYQKALDFDPNDSTSLSNLGNLFRDMGRNEDAVSSYQKALIAKPDIAEVHYSLGNAFKDMEQLEDAIVSYKKALAIVPDYMNARNNLGHAYSKMGWLKDAIINYQKVLNFNSDFPLAWVGLKTCTKALLFSKLNEKQQSSSCKNGLSQAVQSTTDFAMFKYYLDSFQPHESGKSFEQAIAALPNINDEELSIRGIGSAPVKSTQLPNKFVALLHFGRSGTGLLHSLIDGHPEISTLPGVYLRGFFNAGIWKKLTVDGWRGLPERFADEFAVLFDANSAKTTPGILSENSSFLGRKEGMTGVGENRSESLSIDRNKFCTEALQLIKGLNKIDPKSFFLVVHEAIERVMESKTKKHTIFYHIHNPDDFSKLNFLRYAPDARLVMMVREPVSCCESWVRSGSKDNEYDNFVSRIIPMLFDIDQIAFRTQDSVGIRLEDLKMRPKKTIPSMCKWLRIGETQSLYRMTAQGKKWWGDPTSPDYDDKNAMEAFGDTLNKRSIENLFSEQDQYILRTLFYPFNARFGYTEANPVRFKKELKEIRPLLDEMLDFEMTLSEKSKLDPATFTQNAVYRLLHASFIDRWSVLNEFGTYPHMLTPLVIG